MVRRLALVVVGSLVAGAGSLGGGQEPLEPRFIVRGIVTMITAPEGGETVVAIDRDDDGQPADGIVDYAFRIQHTKDSRFAFSGTGAVSVQPHRLTLAATPDRGWVFTIASREAEFPPSVSSYTSVLIQGLSRHRGAAIQRGPDDVTALLLGGICTAAAGGACTTCDTGGNGVQGCTLEGAGGCWADCTEGFFACCNPGGCRCCEAREAGQLSSKYMRQPR